MGLLKASRTVSLMEIPKGIAMVYWMDLETAYVKAIATVPDLVQKKEFWLFLGAVSMMIVPRWHFDMTRLLRLVADMTSVPHSIADIFPN
jgi:hypothetical protein